MSYLKDQLKRRFKETLSNVVEDTIGSAIRKIFNIGLYTYPADLTSQDSLHYVEFTIVERGKSIRASPNRSKIKEGDAPSQGAVDNPTEEELANVATTTAAVAGGIGLSRLVSSTGAGGQFVAGVVGAVAVDFLIEDFSLIEPDTKYILTDVITLHVDGPPSVKYNVNYSNKDIGMLAGLVGPGSAIVDAISSRNMDNFKSAVTGAGAAVGTAVLSKLVSIPSFLGIGDIGAALSAGTGRTLNPFREVIFESMDPRSFTFKYKFLPKSKTETNMVRDIINLFKYHMHPNITNDKLFFIYPSEFDIKYYFRGRENEYIHKFARCVLTSMDVTYGGDQFSSFNDGSPTEVNVSLSFQEVDILTKKSPQIDIGGRFLEEAADTGARSYPADFGPPLVRRPLP